MAVSRTRFLMMQQGDPFLGLGAIARFALPAIGGLFKRGAKRVITTRAIPGIVGPVTRGRGAVTRIAPGIIGRVARAGGRIAGAGAAFEVGARGVRGLLNGEGAAPGRRRRMNPANIRALNRATRRVASFHKLAQKAERNLRKFAPKSRRSVPSGHRATLRHQ